MNYDFTKKELDYIIQNANFTDKQKEIFDRLTDRCGRQKVVKIAIEMNLSERTIYREIRKLKHKIYKIL